MSDILLWTPSHGRAKAVRPARTYIQQFYVDIGCSLENFPGAMDNRDGWRERVREIRIDGVTWRWWWLLSSCPILTPRQYKERHDRIRRSFFQAAVVSILLYGCTTWTLTKRLEKKLEANYTRMLRAILNKSWRQHPTRHQLFGHLPPITKTIQVRRTRHAGHCWRSRDELISDVLLWIPTYGRAKAGRPTRTYIQQLCEDTECSPEDLPEAMSDREKWRERVRDIRAGGTTGGWWWWLWWCNYNGILKSEKYINTNLNQ